MSTNVPCLPIEMSKTAPKPPNGHIRAPSMPSTPLLGRQELHLAYEYERPREMGHLRYLLTRKVSCSLYTPVLASAAAARMLQRLPFTPAGALITSTAIAAVAALGFFLVSTLILTRQLLTRGALLPELSLLPATLGMCVVNAFGCVHVGETQALGWLYWGYIVVAAAVLAVSRRQDGVLSALPLVLAGRVTTEAFACGGGEGVMLLSGLVSWWVGFLAMAKGLLEVWVLVARGGRRDGLWAGALVLGVAGWAAVGGAVQGLAWDEEVGYYGGLMLGLVCWAGATWWGVLAGLGMLEVEREEWREEVWMAAAAGAAWVLVSAELLEVFGGLWAAAVVVEIVAVGLVGSLGVLVAVGVRGMVTGELLQD